jgi:hypothetical protein
VRRVNAPFYLSVQFVKAKIDDLRRRHPELSEDEDAFLLSLESETDLHELMTRLVRQEREAAMMAEGVKTREEELKERRDRFVRQQQAARHLMLTLLESTGKDKLTLPEATVSVSRHGPSPIVNDEQAVPDTFCKFTRRPDMKAIKAALNDGLHIPGVHVSNGSTNLMVRVR